MKRHSPAILFIRGLPGSGKSYLASGLQKNLGNSAVVLDPDAVDVNSESYLEHARRQDSEGIDRRLHLYRFLRALAFQAIEDDKVIIWNQAFTNLELFNKMVARLRGYAAEHHKSLSILIIEVEIDKNIAKDRMLQRVKAGGHGMSDEIWERFVSDYRSFINKGYDVVKVSGEDDVSVSVSKIEEFISNMRQARKA